MGEENISYLRQLLSQPVVRYGGGAVSLVGLYDTFREVVSSEFGITLPTIRAAVGMTGADLLPWWGWLLILQAVLNYALFTYVRQKLPPLSVHPPNQIAPQISATPDYRLEITHLLTWAEGRITSKVLEKLISNAPLAVADLFPEKAEDQKSYVALADEWLGQVESVVTNAPFSARYPFALASARAKASQELKTYDPKFWEHGNAFDFGEYYSRACEVQTAADYMRDMLAELSRSEMDSLAVISNLQKTRR
jgi:hypothetical protein